MFFRCELGFYNCSMLCCALLLCNHLDREERAGCFAKFVFLMSCDFYVAVTWVCLPFVIVVFPNHTRIIFHLGFHCLSKYLE